MAHLRAIDGGGESSATTMVRDDLQPLVAQLLEAVSSGQTREARFLAGQLVEMAETLESLLRSDPA